jgi:hypothetical protein
MLDAIASEFKSFQTGVKSGFEPLRFVMQEECASLQKTGNFSVILLLNGFLLFSVE